RYHHVLKDREIGVNIGALKRPDDALSGNIVRALAGDLAAFEGDSSLRQPDSAAHQVEKRRFPGAVRSYQTQLFSGVDPHIHSRDRLQPPKKLGQAFYLKHGRTSSRIGIAPFSVASEGRPYPREQR